MSVSIAEDVTKLRNKQVSLPEYDAPSTGILTVDSSSDSDDDISVLHNEDEKSYKSESTDTEQTASGSESFRDEMLELQKQVSEDTARVNFWRTASIILLFQTAVAVTLMTSQFLRDREKAAYESGFKQFSGLLADAAIERQQTIHNGLDNIATEVALYVENNNVTWPFVTVPKFEYQAMNVRQQAKLESVIFLPHVAEATKDRYIRYSNYHVQAWVEEGHMIQTGSLEARLLDHNMSTYNPFISKMDPKTGEMVPDMGQENITNTTYSPIWQESPPPAKYDMINYNTRSDPHYKMLREAIEALQYETVAAEMRPWMTTLNSITEEEHAKHHHHDHAEDSHDEDSDDEDSHAEDGPHTVYGKPIHRDISDVQSEIVAIAAVDTAWDVALENKLPSNIKGIHAVVQNSCGQKHTFEVNGADMIYLGEGDLHDEKYDRREVEVDLSLYTHPNFKKTDGHCRYEMVFYPTKTFENIYTGGTPIIFTSIVATTFALVILVFVVYDKFVSARNDNLMTTAARSNAIVTDLFPAHMAKRLKETQDIHGGCKSQRNLKTYLAGGNEINGGSKPLADLFLETTVIFADIVGFTSWSSVREPAQVFTLLESIYQAFDELAKKHRVFKVETVGDCYVAVTGLPEPRVDHAILMARFARGILRKMHVHARLLEKTLGPDTADLSIRVGMHSGPVTAGVLRGERSRFQLFGDTMNMCARMESSSLPGRIHCSKETADLLVKGDKKAWLEKRDDQVACKGYENPLETYWLLPGRERTESIGSNVSSNTDSSTREVSNHVDKRGYEKELRALDERTKRLIDWNVETLSAMIRQVVAHRGNKKRLSESITNDSTLGTALLDFPDLDNMTADEFGNSQGMPLKDVKEIIHLPEFAECTSSDKIDPEKVVLPVEIRRQLHHLVSTIASFYNKNPFHNFDHASHVVMAVTKFMVRIVAPDHLDEDDAEAAHDHTYGITGDPLTGFACAFSALIHDVDHSGVSNAQLVKEEVRIAKVYEGRSVAEQNSLDMSWELLMEPKYEELRNYLFPNPGELKRFRQLVVNCVMSTDIVDKELKELRNSRWEKAFNSDASAIEEDKRDEVNRKATIVIEHIIQAADISHTMQHWHVYRKWNQNLFEELYVAYMNGRMEKDPSTFWFEGEIGFFDFYIIPLTRKLEECKIFGVSSNECLNYALKNKEEWIAKGKQVVESMTKICKAKYGSKSCGTVDC